MSRSTSRLADAFGSGRGASASGGGGGMRQRGLYSDITEEEGGGAAGIRAPERPRRRKGAARLHAAADSTTGESAESAVRRSSASTGGGRLGSSAVLSRRVTSAAAAPKVLAPHARAPGRAPRAVLVERQRRAFASADVEELLEANGVSSRTHGLGDPEDSEAALLPLEAFDNTDFEVREPSQWMELGIEDGGGTQIGVPARALRADSNGVGSFEPCRVIAYDPLTGKFTVEWKSSGEEGKEDGGEEEGGDGEGDGDGERKTGGGGMDGDGVTTLPRIHICFDGEDPARFAERVAAAHAARHEAASLLRYHLYVDCMPADDTPALDAERVSRILSSALSPKAMRSHGGSARPMAMLREVNLDFQRTMNRLVLNRALGAASDHGLLALVRLSPTHPAIAGASKPTPERGLVSVPPHDMEAAAERFRFKFHATRAELVDVRQRVRAEVLALVAPGGLLDASLSRAMPLDEFEATQSRSSAAFAESLREQWVMRTRQHIRQCLGPLGKGDYNIRETDRSTYDMSKLRRLLACVNFMMADALRFATESDVVKFVNAIKNAASVDATVSSAVEVELAAPLADDERSAAQVIGGAELRMRMAASGGPPTPEDEEAARAEVEAAEADFSATRPLRRKPLFAIDVVVVDEEEEEEEEEGVEEEEEGGGEEKKEGEKKEGEKKEKGKKDGGAGGKDGGGEEVAPRKKFSFGTDLEKLVHVPGDCVVRALETLSRIPQVEKMVVDRLLWAHDPMLPHVQPSEPHIKALLDSLEEAVRECVPAAEAYLHSFDEHTDLLNLDPEAVVAEQKEKLEESDEFDHKSVATAVRRYRKLAKQVRDSIPAEPVDVGLWLVSCGGIREELASKYDTIADAFTEMIAERATAKSQEITKAFRVMEKRLGQHPRDIEQLTEIKDFAAAVPDRVKELVSQTNKNNELYDILDSFGTMLPKEQFDLKWMAARGPKLVADKLDSVADSLQAAEETYLADMERDQSTFEESLAALHAEVGSLSSHGDLSEVQSVVVQVRRVKKSVAEAKEKAAVFNQRESLFGKEVTEYTRVQEIARAFDPYCTLWESCADWLESHEQWMQGPFDRLDPEKMEREHGAFAKNMHRSVKAFERLGNESCLAIAKEVKEQVDQFRPVLPLVMALRNPGMRERHWEALSEAVGLHVHPNEDFTLTAALDMGLLDHLETVSKIGERAGKEYQIEQALAKMHAEWEDVDLITEEYRETKTRILKGIDDLQTLLDDHITMTAAMQFSAFKKPFETEIDEWTQTLNTVSEVLDEWVKVQRSWLYLQPIFDSADIQKQLPKEYKRFSTVDKNWRQTLRDAHMKPKAIEFCNSTKLLDRWRESNTFLDLVQKQLSDYLGTKRAAFARFYFLSDAELLDILSSTKDPRAVQDHLKKCFEGLNKVSFNEDMCIEAMISEEGERVPTADLVDPRGKNVENWMTELEDMMRSSVKSVMLDAVTDYDQTERLDWICKWPAQCVLNGSQLHWTRLIEGKLKDGGLDGLRAAYQIQLRQLQDMVTLVRRGLKGQMRNTMSALTVIDVHARDVTKRMLISKVSQINDFSWISQMRYYWHAEGEPADEYTLTGDEHPAWPEVCGEGCEGLESKEGEDVVKVAAEGLKKVPDGTSTFAGLPPCAEYGEEADMWVMMLSSHRPYGYEYLGNSMRLVITPLTDKCYLTLMGALQMNLGGAPAGPAGTGKTETVKDLAKALAKQCVVFNCSDGLTTGAMAKFFKGLASCGAWACFDEFNRIDIEVLSVVAQQIITLQRGVSAGLTRIHFADSEIKLDAQFSVFITMNPGYAGRTELPDNLKALFRPVAMMVPDYALIGEIMLFSFGFEKALSCARKMVATFKLCSEQLSSQDHYDYGMRAVKTVITAAGNLKRNHMDMDEEVLLYRALLDVNLPKFLAHDLPLFQGIMSDLFPGVKRPETDYGDLRRAIVLCTEEMGLQPSPVFITKCIQLYETVVVRHGLMVVGPTGGGKSCIIKVLKKSLSLLAAWDRKGPKFEKVVTHLMNPKAITMGQLYGEFDPNTQEWQDGILAGIIRMCADSHSPDLKWIVFDGPVDALWIENMNTVLDDNKKLCLVSGEIIKLSPQMEIMFEVEDLAVASPATVSRCGMVYTEPESLGIDPIIMSWLATLPKCFDKKMRTLLQRLMDLYISSSLYYLRRYLVEPVPTVNNQLVRSLLNILDCFFERYYEKEGRDDPTAEEIAALQKDLPALFLYALVWSVAATTNEEGRKRFDAFLRSEMDSNGFSIPVPRETELIDGSTGQALLYDFCYDRDAHRWVPWMKTVPEFTFPAGKIEFSKLIIPTKDSVRAKYLARMLLLNRKYMLLTGPTGTGKTVSLNELLAKEMPAEYTQVSVTFSAQTSANQTQDMIDSKVDKRQRGTYGPPAGTFFVLYVDDLNMPQREEYFAQPPIELLRQWCDHGGWYDRKERTFRRIVDTILLASMGPPGGGRNPVTPRMIRHFNVVNNTQLDDESMRAIFSTILGGFLEREAFEEGVRALLDATVTSSVKVYNTICNELLPTPAKPHYTFNLRDLGKVFQGILMITPKKVPAPVDYARLWVHEERRVFEDRLVNPQDRQWFEERLEAQVREQFHLDWDEVVPVDEEAAKALAEARKAAGGGEDGEDDFVAPRKRILFADFLTGSDQRLYEECRDLKQLQGVVEEFLADYNAENTQAQMKLVMFGEAVEHVCRISRILRQPLGNALLLGVGGSGRQSLTRLATFIPDYNLVQVEIAKGYGKNEWREDLKRVLMTAGVEEQQTVFLFSDTQIVFEGMVEDINNVLNSGDVPNLYLPEDFDAIYTACRRDCLNARIPATKINMFQAYLSRVKRHIHIVFCMSPMGEAFRDRLRMFPALVTCSAIDYFDAWPEEALRSVANSAMTETDLKLGDSLPGCVEMFRIVHEGVASASERYLQELRRYNYVTPTSYLELLSTFRTVLDEKRTQVDTMRMRLQKGLDALISAQADVAKLQAELTAMQPELEATQKEVAEMLVHIDAEKKSAAETKVVVEKEEQTASELAAKTKAIADDAENDLARALPALDEAVAVLNKLKKSDIDELRAVRTPGKGVVLTMHAACLVFGVKPTVVTNPDGTKTRDYWASARTSLLGNARKFLDDMKGFKDENGELPDPIISALRPFIEDEAFTPAAVANSNKAAEGVCKWVHAMFLYSTISKEVEPKRQRLAEAQADLDRTNAQLAEAKARLHAVEEQLADLQRRFDEAEARKAELQHDVEVCSGRLERAHKLIGGLGGEKDRWGATVEQLSVDYVNIVGNALIASSTIAYLGAFTSNFRHDLVEEWQADLGRLGVPHTKGCDITSVLADPVLVRQWNIAGLPSDTHSIENGIIMDKARRWPLLIDPQGQANRYIKNLGRDSAPNGLEVLRDTEKKFLQKLENGIRFGKWVLLENIGERLDATLEPVLLQQTFKVNGANMIKLGDATTPYSDDFRFFLTTKLPNPHYPPEVAVKVSLLNFTITPKGLEDQLLGVFIVTEMPALEQRKNNLVVDNARMRKQLKELEDKVLELLSNVTGNILDDVDLIETLAASKETSKEIGTQVAAAEETEKEIDATRESYRPVAFRASILYFCITDLANIDPMYQYSLPWFTGLFVNAIRNSEPSEDATKRIDILNTFFTELMYRNVCRSLFERHKLLFSFLMCQRIMDGDGNIDEAEWRFLISGASPRPADASLVRPEDAWINERIWTEINALGGLPALAGIDREFCEDPSEFQRIFDSADAHREPPPGEWAEKMSGMQRLCLLRVLRPDKVTLAIQDFVVANLGKTFIEPPPFDLSGCYEDSSVATPLIFVLSTGSDPTKAFYEFAESVGMRSKLEGISLGQGQGPIAERMIEKAQAAGEWVLLQNCHLFSSWMTDLERICESIDPDRVSPDFRLWLTSMPTKVFPVSVLQNGVKMTNEPPKGLRANLKNFYYGLNDDDLNLTTKPDVYRKLLFGLAFFHANVQERRKFGPLGWNIPYEFNMSDLDISRRQLELYLDAYEEIPFKVLHFLTSYINYGGRVTDDKDLRTIDVILRDYFCAPALEADYEFSSSGIYRTIEVDDDTPHKGYLEYIDELPINPDPEVFGMHPNANITCDQNEAFDTFDTLISLQPRSAAAGGKSRDEVISEAAADILSKLPKPFDVESIQMRYPVKYEQSYNTVLVQEAVRYNRLLIVMRKALIDIGKAVKGLVVMSADLDDMGTAIQNQKVPDMWAAKAYPSLKPLGAWVVELLDRLEFIKRWSEDGIPPSFWIGGFFFPQGFTTATLQNYARRHTIPIDSLSFDFEVLDIEDADSIEERPSDGCYVHGLFLEGARFDRSKMQLAESLPKQLYTSLPPIHFKPMKDFVGATNGIARVPTYKILSRAGTLSTTGHSTNFVLWLTLNSETLDAPFYNDIGLPDNPDWIKGGVAAFCALRY